MSFTAAYTELYAIRDGKVRSPSDLNHNPRILDPDGLDTVHERTDVSESTFRDLVITDEQKDHGEYPTKTWESLKGFKTWKPTDAFGLEFGPDRDELVRQIENHEDYRTGPLGYGYNIERLGIPYGGLEGAWKTFFAEVSTHTEPFAFYHSPIEHEFPDITDFRDGEESVYYVECYDGEVYVEEQTFERTGTEVLTDGVERFSEEGSDDGE